MKKSVTLLVTTLGLITVLAAGVTLARAQTAAATAPAAGTETSKHKGSEHHPAIHRAIVALEEAKVALQKANHDFGGHRKEALEECDRAIAQLKLALQYDKK